MTYITSAVIIPVAFPASKNPIRLNIHMIHMHWPMSKVFLIPKYLIGIEAKAQVAALTNNTVKTANGIETSIFPVSFKL